MFCGGGVEAMSTGLARPSSSRRTAYVQILEQPASKALRFRYECEGRSAGSIPGVNSTPESKTFPSIRIEGYKGRAVVVVSCVTKDRPFRPHPHNLVGKEVCKRGVCTVEIFPDNMTVTFANLGIQCVKKKDIPEALRIREEIRIDPYRTGFSHRTQPSSIDLNAVRLCFQVFLEGSEKGRFSVPLAPVVSDPIYDKKAMSDLVICKLSDCSSTVAGGKEMILLCEKVVKEDIQVRFFEKQDGQLIWEGFADFQPTHVHKQVAISFRVPRYRVLEVDQPVKVFIQLRRPSDGATSDPLPFEFLPLDSDSELKRKRRYVKDHSTHVLRHLQAEAETQGARCQSLEYGLNSIKAEPLNHDPSLYQAAPISGIPVGNFSPVYRLDRGSPSPQPFAALQPCRQQLSPGPTPSTMEYATAIRPTQYNILPTHLQYHQQLQQHEHQFDVSRQFHCTQNHPHSLQQQMILYKVNTEQSGSTLIPLDPPRTQNQLEKNIKEIKSGSRMPNLDGRQHSSDPKPLNQLDATDLATFNMLDENLSQNFSNSLSLSDIKVSQETEQPMETQEAANAGGGNSNNMTDSLTRLTKNTIQELCTLNNMFNPTKNDIG